ncbi:hypothetical protein OK016_17900 [Vibrio chagasii]|nr:hypothetical protein [Vibrio chagasii]
MNKKTMNDAANAKPSWCQSTILPSGITSQAAATSMEKVKNYDGPRANHYKFYA